MHKTRNSILQSTFLALVVPVGSLGLSPAAIGEPFSVAWDTAQRQEELLRDKHVDARTEPGTLQLRRRVLVHDEIGRTDTRARLLVTDRTWAKKTFLLDSEKARGARLTAFGRGLADNAELLVNGRLVPGPFAPPDSYWQLSWPTIEVPAEYLKAGLNEFILRGKAGKGFGLSIEPSISPARSAVSRDAGATWEKDGLDDARFMEGEFLVRLDLDRYPAEGAVWSAPIDLAAMAANGAIAPRIRVTALTLLPDAEGHAGTSVRYELRAGTTPAFDPQTWTPWREVAAGTPLQDLGAAVPRYAQWRAVLHSSDPLATPKLRAMRLRLDADVEARPQGMDIIRLDNERIVHSSYRFTYLPPGGRTTTLRQLHKLDEVVAPALSEFEKYLLMRQWVRNQWEDGWKAGNLSYIPPWDALLILELASENDSLGMCTHYGTVFTQCSSAVGLVARSFVRGHFINEVWSNEYKKWICMDMSGDVDDTRKRTLHYVKDGIPLSGLEIHRAHLNDEGARVQIFPESSADLYDEGKALANFEHFMIPLRNNHLIVPEPEEPEHGENYFRYIGHLWWIDDRTPPLVWTDLCTGREGDFYPTLNQAEIHLQQGAEPGQLRVDVDTQTPNFRAFQARFDGGDWTKAEADFAWTLRPGENRLDVRPVNAWELPGITSTVAIRYSAP